MCLSAILNYLSVTVTATSDFAQKSVFPYCLTLIFLFIWATLSYFNLCMYVRSLCLYVYAYLGLVPSILTYLIWGIVRTYSEK